MQKDGSGEPTVDIAKGIDKSERIVQWSIKEVNEFHNLLKYIK